MYHNQIVVLPGRRKLCALAADGNAGSLQNKCFTMFQSLGHQNVVFAQVLGVTAPMARLIA